ncbi:hypothetical protein CDAR_3471 [Caerostris darwini]|uniref:LAGLIDADG homing endonuclease n=1 Tax=Caerostris darwini TaxID=1538125 RepID=A0AAV4QVQ0_9ARAC|nr:hypothetical protein CDAR_3471 [Caerostris darwini]
MYATYIHFEYRDKPLNSRPAALTLRLITLITLLGREVRGLKCNFPSTEVTFKSRALSFHALELVKRVENADPYHFILKLLFGKTFASVFRIMDKIMPFKSFLITSIAAVNTGWRRITWWYFSNDEKSYVWIQFNGEFSVSNFQKRPFKNLVFRLD